MHDLGDLAADEIGGQLIGGRVTHEITEAGQEHGSALLPQILHLIPERLGREIDGVGRRPLVPVAECSGHPAVSLPERGVLGLDGRLLGRIEGTVLRGDGELRRSLEDRQVRGGLSDHRDGLDSRGSGPDDADALAREVDAIVGPATGVDQLAGEGVPPFDVGKVGGREATGGHDDEPGGDRLAGVGGDPPPQPVLVEDRRFDPRLEGDVAAKIEPVGDVLGVPKDLGLGGVALGPLPFLLQLVVEVIGVLHAVDVTAGARVPVPVPGSAHVGPGLETADRAARRRHPMDQVHAGEAGTDHDRVDRRCIVHLLVAHRQEGTRGSQPGRTWGRRLS